MQYKFYKLKNIYLFKNKNQEHLNKIFHCIEITIYGKYKY